MPAPRPIIAFVAAALVLPVAGCGDEEKGLLSTTDANRLTENLDQIDQAIDNGRCEYAAKVIGDGTADAEQLAAVSGKLKRNIVEGYERLDARLSADCEKAEETPTPTPTEEATEAPTEAPTEVPTEVPTEEPTEEPTEVPTEVPTEAPTEPPGFPTPDTGTGGASPEEDDFG